MAEYSDFQHGGVSFPLVAATTNSLLQDADPALFYALDYFRWVITNEVGARLLAQAAGVASNIAAAVAMAVPFDPGPYLTSDQCKFPLLACYRIEETLEMRTITWKHSVAVWGVAYVLPPMTAGQVEVIGPILNAAARALDNRTEQGFDPGYTPPGGAAGGRVWTLAGLEQIGFRRGKFARWDDGEDLVFQAYIAELEVQERVRTKTGAFPALTSVAASVEARVPNDTGSAVETVELEQTT